MSNPASQKAENPFAATEWQKHQAYEWLRNISLGDTEIARIAAICLVEWNKAMAGKSAGPAGPSADECIGAVQNSITSGDSCCYDTIDLACDAIRVLKASSRYATYCGIGDDK